MYVPLIGDSGIYTLKEPYNVLVTPQVIYTCRSIRSMNDIAASGVSVFEKYYQSLGISENIYLQDAANNVSIIGLQAGTGEWIYVPQTYILKPPITSGVKYSSIVLGIGLGAIPDEMNLEDLTATIKEIVLSSIGIDSKIKAVLVSQPAFISHDKHERLETARQAKIQMDDSLYSKVKQLQNENALLATKIKELETYIRKSL